MDHYTDIPKITNLASLSENYTYFIFDCDGVLWFGNSQIGNSFRNIEWLHSQGKKIFFVTNHAGHSRKSIAAKMISDAF